MRENRASLPAAMITIGCAGFPVPATRYFKEFLFVEVQETHVTLPGTDCVSVSAAFFSPSHS